METSFAAPSPMAVPKNPPTQLTTTASQRNCKRMVSLRAPSARRMPISRVRSFTETSRMFMTPMPPTMAVMKPMTKTTSFICFVMSPNMLSIRSWRLTAKLSSLSGASRR